MINENIRVRFAPSPTGFLHVGGLRTALYNFLFARKNNGKFILRIEDTDRNRFVEGAIENLIKTLNWCELNFDEGPFVGGDFGPYLQSFRLDIYKKFVYELIAKEKAYYCFCSPQRLEELRNEQQRNKVPQAKYDKHCLKLSQTEIGENLSKSIPYVIRLNVEPNRKVIFNDVVREQVEFDTNNIDDQILLKSDGYPTYHLANVVDDHLMKITHVIRGEEWISSTPKHILLYDFFEWDKPIFAHLPLLLNPDRSKLSKRQSDVAVEDYKDKGYLKEGLLNFVALLGWNAGDDKEFYYLNELIDNFSLERINKAGAVFDVVKLNSLNAMHLRKKSNEDLLNLLKEELQKSSLINKNFSDEFLLSVINAMKERVTFNYEFISACKYFYEAPKEFEQNSIEKNWKPETLEQLKILNNEFSTLENPNKEDYEQALTKIAEQLKIGNGKLIHPLRLAVTGQSTGPGVFDILFILGKNEVVQRINEAINKIKIPL